MSESERPSMAPGPMLYLQNQRLGTALNPGVATNVPQNSIGQFLADKLYGARGALNRNIGLPFVETGLGFGDLLMGESPELLEDVSWGQPVIRPGGHGPTIDPRVMDVAGLPIPYVGAAKGLQYGGKSILNKVRPDSRTLEEIARTDPELAKQLASERVDTMFEDTIPRGEGESRQFAPIESPVMDESRRSFLKAFGLGGAAAAFPLTTLKALKETAAKPHPYYSEAVVADLARPVAGAAVRAATMSPRTAGIAAYLRSIPGAAAAIKSNGLRKYLDEIADTDAEPFLEDLKEYADSFDEVEVEDIIRGDADIDVVSDYFKLKNTGDSSISGEPGEVLAQQLEYIDVFKGDAFKNWVDDYVTPTSGESIYEDILSDIVNSTAKNLDDIKNNYLKKVEGKSPYFAEKIIEVFDDPKLAEKLSQSDLTGALRYGDGLDSIFE